MMPSMEELESGSTPTGDKKVTIPDVDDEPSELEESKSGVEVRENAKYEDEEQEEDDDDDEGDSGFEDNAAFKNLDKLMMGSTVIQRDD